MKIRRAAGILRRIRDARLEEALEQARAEAERLGLSLYLVGGCVRDLVLGRRLQDLDLAVEGEVKGLARGLSRRWGAEQADPSPFGTCRLSPAGGPPVDIAMSRRERYPVPAALPRVERAPILEDLLRRDFTLNSMAIGLTGPSRNLLLDPSAGYEDARRRLLRPHHPMTLVDDPTRALRASRFATRLSLRGTREWGAALRARGVAGAFHALSGDRLRREILLVRSEPDPASVFSRASRWDLARRIHPRLLLDRSLRQSLRRAGEVELREPGLGPDLLLALLTRRLPPRSRAAFLKRLGLRGARARLLCRAAGAPEEVARLFRSCSRKRGPIPAETLEAASLLDPVFLALIRAVAPRAAARVSTARDTWAAAEPILSGRDLLGLGVPEGPRVGRFLEALRRGRLSGKLSSRGDETQEILRLIRRRS